MKMISVLFGVYFFLCFKGFSQSECCLKMVDSSRISDYVNFISEKAVGASVYLKGISAHTLEKRIYFFTKDDYIFFLKDSIKNNASLLDTLRNHLKNGIRIPEYAQKYFEKFEVRNFVVYDSLKSIPFRQLLNTFFYPENGLLRPQFYHYFAPLMLLFHDYYVVLEYMPQARIAAPSYVFLKQSGCFDN